MTWERPWALALLLAPPLLLWLHRRRGAADVTVASVLPFVTDDVASASSPSRRTPDAALLLTLAAAVVLAVAAAGPRGAAGNDAVLVLVDRSASMEALDAQGRAVGATALDRAEALLADAAPRAEIRRRDVAAGAFEEALRVADAEGWPAVLFVTDDGAVRRPGVVVIGPAAPAGPNVALTAVTLDAPEVVAVVENFGTAPADVGVGDGATAEVRVQLGAASRAEVRLPAPPPGGRGSVSVSPGGSLAADDVLRYRRTGGAREVRLESDAACPRLAAAVRAVAASGDGAPVVVRRRGALRAAGPDATRVVHFAPESAASGASMAIDAASGTVDASSLVGRGPLGEALPRPGSRLESTGRIRGGAPFLLDAAGALGAADASTVAVTLDPETSPEIDAWVVVLLAAAVDELSGGPDRVVAENALPRGESDVPGASAAVPTPEELRAAVRAAAPDPSGAASLLAAVGAALAAAAAWVGRRR